MATTYHVAHSTYRTGEHLYCQDELWEMGIEMPWKFDGEAADTDVVCVFDTLAEAREFQKVFAPDHIILAIDLEVYDGTIVEVEEGYTAVFGRIPAHCIIGPVDGQ